MKKFYLFCLLLILIPFTSAFPITTDEITETSIVWNLSQRDANITKIAFDGIEQTGYITNPSIIVQTGLYQKETHYINVFDDIGNESTAHATTLEKPSAQWWEFASGYFLFIIAIICIIIGLFVPFIAFAGCGFAIIGIVEMQGVSFWGGFIFMVVFCAGVFVGFAKHRGE